MPDGPFKGMTRDKDSQRRKFDANPVRCEKCGGYVFEGDWPFCKGDPSGHVR
jgi:hypothetical protein